MSDFVTRDDIRSSRVADLYSFMLEHHASEVLQVGQCLQVKQHDSLMIKKGYPGYVRNSTGESGNPVDFLVKYMGYSFTEAVKALSGSVPVSSGGAFPDALAGPLTVSISHDIKSATYVQMSFPEACEKPYKRAYAYLTYTRGLSSFVVNALIDKGLVYQDLEGNVVFLNHEKSYCEIRGTLSHIKFHRSYRANPDTPFWYFHAGKGLSTAYVCESAIDAISLYEILKGKGNLEKGTTFFSIGGAGKQNAIERVLQSGHNKVIIAADRDEAGKQCRDRNGNLPFIVPEHKDWNEDLLVLKGRGSDQST